MNIFSEILFIVWKIFIIGGVVYGAFTQMLNTEKGDNL